MHVAIHVGERGDDLGLQRVPDVENEGPASQVIVGKQHAAHRHNVFGMVDLFGLLVGDEGGHQLAVRGRSRVGINNGEKVSTFVGNVTGPGEHVMAGRVRLLRLTL